MKMELIQPFINAADAVLAETLQGPTNVSDIHMEESAYARKGVAAIISIQGDIEGRVIFDLTKTAGVAIASALAGGPVSETEGMVEETIFELANLVIGNAITSLNDQGFHFKISPPEIYSEERGMKSSEDTEALVMCIDTSAGEVYVNIAMRYNRRRRVERATTAAS